jgi:hypothetical protein
VLVVNGELVSVFYLLEATLCGWPVRYLYAACTHPAHRAKGYMGRLLGFAQARFPKIALLPAGPELYAYYAKFGFAARFAWQVCTLTRASLGQAKPALAVRLLPRELAALREKNLAPVPHLSWNEAAVAYAVAAGGELFCCKSGYALYTRSRGHVLVRELCCPPDAAPGLLAALDFETCTLRAPAGLALPFAGKAVPGGMLWGDVPGHDFYLGLAME